MAKFNFNMYFQGKRSRTFKHFIFVIEGV